MKYIIPLLTALSLLLYNCAQQVAPTGGKKDIIPPELVTSFPENKAINFTEKVIKLTFNEYVVIDNLMQKLIITPQTENPYTPRVNGMSVDLRFKNNFADSTTYTLNFGDGIKDFAERNPARNLKLVFSTGSTLDSGSVYGTVKDIQTGKPVFDALVGLYKLSDTLTAEKIKPYYFSKTDSTGHFAIENTQIGNYALIALTDKNRNLLYNPKEDNIAFLDSAILIQSDTTHYHLQTFRSDVSPVNVQRSIPKVNSYSVVFNKPIENAEVIFQEDSIALPYFLENPTTLKFYKTDLALDSLRAKVITIDSLGYKKEFDQKLSFSKQRGKEVAKDPLGITILPEKGKDITLNQKIELTFTKPISQFNTELVKFKADSIPINYKLDSSSIIWNKYKTNLEFTIDVKAKDSLSIDFPKGTFLGIENDTLANNNVLYTILNAENYGIIRGKIENPNNRTIILELVDKANKVVKRVFTSIFTFENIKPDTYTLRLIIDSNNNKRWDTGDYLKKIQPEQILVYPTPLEIKSNFEYEDTYFKID